MQKTVFWTIIVILILAAFFVLFLGNGPTVPNENENIPTTTPGGDTDNNEGADTSGIVYRNASSDNIVVELPSPGAVVGKEFSVLGEARGPWYFEASFPIEVVGPTGERLSVAVAQAQDEWMTTEFVPFRADIVVPETYTGPATLILHKDNPSGLPEHDASVSFPIIIEY